MLVFLVTMEDDLADLNLNDEEEDAFQEEEATMDNQHQFNLMGRCLTGCAFPSIKEHNGKSMASNRRDLHI